MNRLINYEGQRLENLFRIRKAKWAISSWTWAMRVASMGGFRYGEEDLGVRRVLGEKAYR